MTPSGATVRRIRDFPICRACNSAVMARHARDVRAAVMHARAWWSRYICRSIGAWADALT